MSFSQHFEPTIDLATELRHSFKFHGNARDYFRIWIVNLGLTIITLGIYSAWAKVRRLRYFYGNTALDGHSFEYHASPIAILKGRLLIVGLIVAYNVLHAFTPLAAVLIIPGIFIWPWMINRSLSFQAQMTSYRTLRFSFSGSYGSAFMVYVILPALAVMTAGLLAPVAARAKWDYLADNLRYGDGRFASNSTIGPFYAHFGATIGFSFICAFFAIALPALLTLLASGSDAKEAALFSIFSLGYLLFALVFVFWRVGVRNIGVSNIILARDFRFRSDLGRFVFVWITASNVVLTILTLGLLRPWAAIRSWRYAAENTSVRSARPLDDFVGEMNTAGLVSAAEFADLQSVDFGF